MNENRQLVMELSGKRVQIKNILAAVVLSVLGYSDLSTIMISTHIFDEEVENTLKSFRQVVAVVM